MIRVLASYAALPVGVGSPRRAREADGAGPSAFCWVAARRGSATAAIRHGTLKRPSEQRPQWRVLPRAISTNEASRICRRAPTRGSSSFWRSAGASRGRMGVRCTPFESVGEAADDERVTPQAWIGVDARGGQVVELLHRAIGPGAHLAAREVVGFLSV